MFFESLHKEILYYAEAEDGFSANGPGFDNGEGLLTLSKAKELHKQLGEVIKELEEK